jgi:ADP-ribose pyrophosphatase
VEETVIKSQDIYDGRLVHLKLHDVRLPDGATSIREIIHHPGAVALIAVDNDQQVLLVRQFRLAANRIMIEIPAGTLEPGEEPEACAIRELQEETGYKPNQVEALGGLYVAPGYTTEYLRLFYATDLEPSTLEQDDDEFLELMRVPFREALDMIERGDIIDGKTIAGLLRVASKLKL